MRFKQETIRCDGCNTILKEPVFYINNGSHQETIITINDKDLCMSCFGRAADMYFRENKIYVSELEPFIEKIKPYSSRVTLLKDGGIGTTYANGVSSHGIGITFLNTNEGPFNAK